MLLLLLLLHRWKMWLLLVFVVLISYILQNYYVIIRGFFLARNIDGPTSFPIIGSAHHFIGKTRAGKNECGAIHKMIFTTHFSISIDFYRDLWNHNELGKAIWRLFQSLGWIWIEIICRGSKRHWGEGVQNRFLIKWKKITSFDSIWIIHRSFWVARDVWTNRRTIIC